MAVFRVSITSSHTTHPAHIADRASRADDKLHAKEIHVRLPSEISSCYYRIKLPTKPTYTKIGDMNTLLVDFPLCQESNKALENIRRQIIDSNDSNTLMFSQGLAQRPSERIYHAEEIIERQQDDVIQDLKLLYKELVNWFSSNSKTSNQSKRQKRDESHDETKAGDHDRLKDIWYDLVEALQWVALFHVLFYLFLIGLSLGVLFITEYE